MEAASDLETLAEYIAKDSAFYAAAFVQEVLDAGCSLKEFYLRGRIVPEFADRTIRELFVREYRLIYTVEESRVVILGLIHGRRELKRLWREEKRG